MRKAKNLLRLIVNKKGTGNKKMVIMEPFLKKCSTCAPFWAFEKKVKGDERKCQNSARVVKKYFD
jgi:hypothetical protein